MTKEEFLEIIDAAIAANVPLTVEVHTIDTVRPEYIVNPATNLEYKRRYYNDAYDDNMTLKAAKGSVWIGAAYQGGPSL